MTQRRPREAGRPQSGGPRGRGARPAKLRRPQCAVERGKRIRRRRRGRGAGRRGATPAKRGRGAGWGLLWWRLEQRRTAPGDALGAVGMRPGGSLFPECEILVRREGRVRRGMRRADSTFGGAPRVNPARQRGPAKEGREGRGPVPRPVAGPRGGCHLRLPLSLWGHRLLGGRCLGWRGRRRQTLGAGASASGGCERPPGQTHGATPWLPPRLQSSPKWIMTPPPPLPAFLDPTVASSLWPVPRRLFSAAQIWPFPPPLLLAPKCARLGTSWPAGSPAALPAPGPTVLAPLRGSCWPTSL